MGSIDPHSLDVVYRALDQLSAAESASDLSAAFLAAIAPFGGEHYVIASSRLNRSLFSRMIILGHWPRAWTSHYEREGLAAVDPVALLARATTTTFCWHDAAARYQTPKAQRVMQISARDYHLSKGISVPIHGLNGYEATISVAGRDLDCSPAARLAIEMAGTFVFRTALNAKQKTRSYLLTAREREVMGWAAAGKSAWDTSEILGISEQTVKSHIASACSKLQVSSKVQAVAEAIRCGEIRV